MDFPTLVLNRFSFLKAMGFEVEASLPATVVFRSAGVQIVVLIGVRSRNLGLEISQLINGEPIPSRGYGINQIAKWGKFPLRHLQVTTWRAADRGLIWLAEVLRDYCQPLTTGNRDAFEALKTQSETDNIKYNVEVQRGHLIPLAKAAFAAKEYSQVVNYLAPLVDSLSDSERKMLDIARRRSQGS